MAQRVQESIEVRAPVKDIYSYWSNFSNILSNPERNLREDLENFARIVELRGPGTQTPSRYRPICYGVVWRLSGGKARRPLHLRGRNSSWVLP